MGSGWSSEEEERQPLLGPGLGPAPGATRRGREAAAVLPAAGPSPGRVYGRRWLVLLLFSLLAFAQGLVWNTWGPIQNSARQAYSFTGWDIALLVLWGPIGFLPCFAFMWLLDKRGLRITVLLTSFLMVLGTGLRCIPVSDLTLKKRLIHGGQILNGLAGPTVMNAAPFLSTTWFSADERATATAIASMLSYLGGACAFLVGPLVVPAPNGTAPLLTAESSRDHIKDRIETVLYAEFGVVCLIFSATLAYFPPRPPLPPSVAAASQRLSYRRSFCRLLSNLRFLMIALAYAIPLGVFAGWSGVLDLILTPVHVSQVDAGWIGFWSIVGGCVVGIAMARFADFIRGMLKLILLLLFSGATLSSTWFTLTCLNSVTHLPLTTGLRITVLLTSFLMVLGTGLRCIPVSDLTLKKRACPPCWALGATDNQNSQGLSRPLMARALLQALECTVLSLYPRLCVWEGPQDLTLLAAHYGNPNSIPYFHHGGINGARRSQKWDLSVWGHSDV